MKDYKSIIESDKSAEEIFESISEKSSAGQVLRVNDTIRILQDQGKFKQGDTVKIKTISGDPSASFTIGVEGGGSLSLTRADVDKKFQMVYDS